MEDKEYPFEFSVIMAVYNVEPYLREAVDSLIEQDFGFENIQLIMVDDGSTDESGIICDEYARQYPDNIIVIHKENGGSSSARNAGVKVAQGRYLNFLDSDDMFDERVFSSVYSFFREHEEETFVVSVPMMLFGEQTGPHIANGKFAQGTRVIDLEEEWWNFQMSLASAFLREDAAKRLCFREDLVMSNAEDARELVKLFVEKPRLGVVNEKEYYQYRKRAGSQITSGKKNKLYYLEYVRDFSKWTVQYSFNMLGFVPRHIQNMIIRDLQWRLRQPQVPDGLLSEEETNQYIEEITTVLKYIDDDIIVAQKNMWTEQKSYVLTQKYGHIPQKVRWQKDVLYVYGNFAAFKMSNLPITLEFVKIEGDKLALEGWVPHHCYLENNPLPLRVSFADEIYTPTDVERKDDVQFCGIEICQRRGFYVELPLAEIEAETFSFFCETEFGNVKMGKLRYGKFFPLTATYQKSYFQENGWKLSRAKGGLRIQRCGRRGHFQSERAFCKEVWKKKRLGGRKAVLARTAYHILKILKKKPIWLVSDRIMKADDNGEAFFRYLQEAHKSDIRSYFVLSKQSTDFQRMKKVGPVVDNLSWKHKLLFLLCDYNISAQADEITQDPFSGYHDAVKDMLCQERFVFLQHGIIKDDLSGWLKKYNKNFSGFVTSTYPEYQSILDGDYFYDEKTVWLTGLPRFDRLYRAEDKEKYITIMPTWRKYLMQGIEADTGIWKLSATFSESDYCRFYHGLLNSPKLLAAAEHLHYTVRFFPHPNLQPHREVFAPDQRVEAFGFDEKYRDIYAQSDLVVTDYSSACFDFAYLRKPVIYCQFDAEEFFEGEHTYTKGYFDYERDGFGEVEYDLDSTVDRIVEYMENGCQLKDKYRERIDRFFAFNDRNNCQRVYEKIMELDK